MYISLCKQSDLGLHDFPFLVRMFNGYVDLFKSFC